MKNHHQSPSTRTSFVQRVSCCMNLTNSNELRTFEDDVCCSLLEDAVAPFLMHQKENQHQRPFLDILLKHNTDCSISTCVYRKLTHTNRYIDFSSHHPLAHKTAVVKSLFYRAQALSSCAVGITEEQLKIIKTLKYYNFLLFCEQDVS